MRRTIALAAVAGALMLPLSAQAAHPPTAAEKAAIEKAISKHFHGKLTGLRHRLSDIDKKYGGFAWSKYVPNARVNGLTTGSADIPQVGMGYVKKYAGKWIVVGHTRARKGRATGCSKVPARIREELAKGLKVKAC